MQSGRSFVMVEIFNSNTTEIWVAYGELKCAKIVTNDTINLFI